MTEVSSSLVQEYFGKPYRAVEGGMATLIGMDTPVLVAARAPCNHQGFPLGYADSRWHGNWILNGDRTNMATDHSVRVRLFSPSSTPS